MTDHTARTHWRCGPVSARSATLLLRGPGLRHDLPRPTAWWLSADGRRVAEGRTDRVAVTLDGLVPDTDYTFDSDAGRLTFRTPACAGLVEAGGLDPAPGADNGAALAALLARVPAGGTLAIPPGRWMTGPLQLPSDITLYLPRGAELAAIADRELIPILPARHADGRPFSSWEGQPAAAYAPLLWADGARRLTIAGQGVLDGGGDRGDWWSWPKETRNGARRARTLFLSRCRDVAISGVTLRNAPSWTLHPVLCDGLTIAGVTIENPPDSPNTDGLNPESCTDTRILGCRISVGDDCIAIKAGKPTGLPPEDHLAPCQGIEIANCRFEAGHGGVVIGSEMSGGVRDVRVRDCHFDGTDRGLRIKTRRGRGGAVDGITLTDCVMERVGVGLAVNAHYFCDADGHSEFVQSRAPRPVDDGTPRLGKIGMHRVEMREVGLAVAAILGLPEAPAGPVTLSEIGATFATGTSPAVPLMADHLATVAGAGILAACADIRLDGGRTADPLRTTENQTC